MKHLILVILVIFLTGCAAVKEIPVKDYEKIVYRDSTVYIRDTVTIEVPKEIIKEIVPQDTTSILRTSVALSEAKIEKGMLHHKLEQQGQIKTVYDTIVTVQYVDRIVEKDKIIEVEVEKKYIPEWCYWCLIYAIVLTLLVAFYVYLKLKR